MFYEIIQNLDKIWSSEEAKLVKFPQYILPVLTILRPSLQQHLPEPKHGVVAAVVLWVLTHEVKLQTSAASVARADRGHLHYTEAGYSQRWHQWRSFSLRLWRVSLSSSITSETILQSWDFKIKWRLKFNFSNYLWYKEQMFEVSKLCQECE